VGDIAIAHGGDLSLRSDTSPERHGTTGYHRQYDEDGAAAA
jgi:hypothetical protein